MASTSLSTWDLISWQSLSDITSSVITGGSVVRRESYLYATRPHAQRSNSFKLGPAASPTAKMVLSPRESQQRQSKMMPNSNNSNRVVVEAPPPSTTEQTAEKNVRPGASVQAIRDIDDAAVDQVFVVNRDIATLVVVFILSFSAVRAIQMLQSSINVSLGVAALIIFHSSVAISVLVVAAALKSGCSNRCLVFEAAPRYTLLLGLGLVIVWLTANVAPNPFILLPAGLLGGIGLTLTWTAQMQVFQMFFQSRTGGGDDITNNAKVANSINSGIGGRSNVLRRLLLRNNLLFALFQSSHIWGNLGGAVILLAMPSHQELPGRVIQVIPSNGNLSQARNATLLPDWSFSSPLGAIDMLANLTNQFDDVWMTCRNGSVFFDKMVDSSQWLNPTTTFKLVGDYQHDSIVWVVVCWQVLLGCLAMLLAVLFFHPKLQPKTKDENDDNDSCCQRLQSLTVQHVRQLFDDAHFRLLAPLLFFNGFEQGFLYVDYTALYSTCLTGLTSTCFSAMTIGLTSCAFSLIAARLASKSLQRQLTISCATILHCSLLVFLYLWKAYPSYPIIVVMLPVLFGLCDSVWQTVSYVLITKVAPPETHGIAFSNFRLLQSVGIATSSLLSFVGGLPLKLLALTTSLLVSLLCYAILENRIRRAELDAEDRQRWIKAFGRLTTTLVTTTAQPIPHQMLQKRLQPAETSACHNSKISPLALSSPPEQSSYTEKRKRDGAGDTEQQQPTTEQSFGDEVLTMTLTCVSSRTEFSDPSEQSYSSLTRTRSHSIALRQSSLKQAIIEVLDEEV